MKDAEKVTKRLTIGSLVRKTLADVTNIENPKFLLEDSNNNPALVLQQLLKENERLLTLIEEKNKVIQLSGTELGSLRMTIQKLQSQNRSLAQTNSQMLLELNSGKDKLKALHHELLCKEALLNVKRSEANVQKKLEAGIQECGTVGVDKLHRDCSKIEETTGMSVGTSGRSKSLGPCIARQRVEQETVETKRRRLRRSSAEFKSNEQPPAEGFFEIDFKLPITKKGDSSSPHSVDLAGRGSDQSVMTSPDSSQSEERFQHRSSIGRPLRRAAGKIESYKERSLRDKMRRE